MRNLFVLTALSLAVVVSVHADAAIRQTLVRIQSATQEPNYRVPWQSGRMGGGNGTGFIIEGNRIVTNAHVVRNTVNLRVTRDGDPKSYPARVEFAANDCDLAIVRVDDQSFFKDIKPLPFGDIPKLNTTVTVFGFPVGGNRISITRGVTSRIEFRTYVHSAADSHLAIQIDAAINPGNSGGPVIQDGKVVGVAFQGLRSAQNTGYMIPMPVLRHVLKDIEDGKYDGYVDLSINYLPLHNPAMRKALGIDGHKNGVLVSQVQKKGSADGVLNEGDVLLKVNGQDIDQDGRIKLDGETVRMSEIAERKFAGDKVIFDVLRDGKMMKQTVTLKAFTHGRVYANQYGKRPRYVLFAGLLFQPLTRNLIAQHKISDRRALTTYRNYVRDELYLERPEMVVLTEVLEDPANTGYKWAKHKFVDTVNGVTIKSLRDVKTALEKKVEFHVIKVDGINMPIVLHKDDIAAARERVMKRYGVRQESYLGDK